MDDLPGKYAITRQLCDALSQVNSQIANANTISINQEFINKAGKIVPIVYDGEEHVDYRFDRVFQIGNQKLYQFKKYTGG
jgi:hypothetical protein